MSSFGGLMEEYKFMSIDRFDGPNLLSSVYFLSHCHTDHMVGLAGAKFLKRLERDTFTRLYTSEITKGLLLADPRFENLKKYVVALPLENPTVLDFHRTDGQVTCVAVTLISAGHCPGSVMFLFEGNEGNVLYTGDFRMPKGSAERIRPLHMFDKTKKAIDSIYVDTTFCSTNAVYIPKREDCVNSLIYLIKDWLARDKDNAVRMNLSAKYGYEFIFNALNKELKCKIYCSRKHLYRCLPKTYNILTENPDWVRIFACLSMDKIDKPTTDRPLNFISIKLSTLYFISQALPDKIYEKISDTQYRFCFSFHSSYSEVCDFVKYVNPGKVFANVIPYCQTPLEEVARDLALKCGLKPHPVAPVTKTRPEKLPISHTGRNQEGAHSCQSVKRAVSFTDVEDTQDCWDGIVEKAKKKDMKIGSKSLHVQHHEHTDGIPRLAKPKFTVPCSPYRKAPADCEIDALHVKLALDETSSM